MTREEWIESADARAMIEFLRQERGDDPLLARQLHRYFVACCRGIWPLLPQAESRNGIEAAERYLAGEITDQELGAANYDAEGAAFCIDYGTEPEAIRGWIRETEAIEASDLAAMLSPQEVPEDVDTRELLLRAAYFADFAMIYPELRAIGEPDDLVIPREKYALFLSADVLRDQIDYPFAQ